MTTSRLRAIWTAPDGVQVFDRRADVAEAHPLPAEALLAAEGRRLLQARIATTPDAGPTRDEREALEALGYLR